MLTALARVPGKTSFRPSGANRLVYHTTAPIRLLALWQSEHAAVAPSVRWCDMTSAKRAQQLANIDSPRTLMCKLHVSCPAGTPFRLERCKLQGQCNHELLCIAFCPSRTADHRVTASRAKLSSSHHLGSCIISAPMLPIPAKNTHSHKPTAPGW